MVRSHKLMTKVAPAPAVARKDTHVTHADAPVRPGISPQVPGSMPRAEDDAETLAHSRDFHDRPGSGRDTANRLKFF
jgi:hypothetical protein